MNEKDENWWIVAGSDLAGAGVGGVAGFVFGGPVGSAVGGMLGVGVAKGLAEMGQRLISRREEVRIGAAGIFALQAIKEKMDAGALPRTDGFFASDGTERSKADEILEGTLIAAKNSYEEKKVRLLGNLYANIAFAESCSPEEANYLIKQVEQISYAQMVLMKVFNAPSRYSLRQDSYASRQGVHVSTLALLQEILDLCRRGLVIMQRVGAPHHIIVLEVNQIIPKDLKLTNSGHRLFVMTGLETISEEDVEVVLQPLRNRGNE